MKICTKCKENKELSKFSRKSESKDGYKARCKCCQSLENKKWYEVKSGEIKTINKDWYDKNKEKESIRKQEQYIRDRDKIQIRNTAWKKANPVKRAASKAKYRATKLKAIPETLTKEDWNKIEETYAEARKLTKESGIPHHVDHIVPLQPKEGSPKGEHAPWNLQILTAEENLKKGNKTQ